MEEKRKPVEGYEGLYEVSDQGNVYSLSKWVGHYTKPSKKLKQSNSNGYLRVVLSKDGKTKKFFVHRLVAAAFIDNKEDKEFVNHKDSVRTNNSVLNLEWCTASENYTHGADTGFINTYRKHISWETRLSVYNEYSPGSVKFGVKQISEKYGIGEQTVLNIKYEMDILISSILKDGITIIGKKYQLKEVI